MADLEVVGYTPEPGSLDDRVTREIANDLLKSLHHATRNIRNMGDKAKFGFGGMCALMVSCFCSAIRADFRLEVFDLMVKGMRTEIERQVKMEEEHNVAGG